VYHFFMRQSGLPSLHWWTPAKLVIELTKGVVAATGWLIVSATLTLTAGYLTDALTVITP
jgi:hypothetical protein